MYDNTKIFFGVASTIILIFKFIIHQYIDKKNGYQHKSSTANRINPLLLLPYYQEVNSTTNKLKQLCNILWSLFVITFSIFIYI